MGGYVGAFGGHRGYEELDIYFLYAKEIFYLVLLL